MKKRVKKIFLYLGSVAALLVIAAVLTLVFVNANVYKPFAEAAVSDALGMDFKINGRLGMTLLPFGLSAHDVRVKNKDTDFLSAEKLVIGLEFIPLLRREIRINKFSADKPKFFIERDKKGKFNFERKKKPEKDKGFPAELLSIEKVSVSKGEVSYLDKLSGLSRELKDFDLTVTNLEFKGQKKEGILKNISFEGDFKAKEIRTKDLELKDIKFGIKGNGGILGISPLSVSLFGGKGKGSMEIDITKDESVIKIQFAASKFQFEKFVETISPKKIIKGTMDFNIYITAKGKNFEEMKKKVNGEVMLKGDNLMLYSMDIDNLLTKIEKSRSFSLIDIGTFFLVGPLGIVATKGYDYAALYRATGQAEGSIDKLVSKWKIKNSVSQAADVALTTKKNRLALQGRLDFVNKRYVTVVVGVVDEKGCLKLSQKIEGPFSKPKIERMSTAETLAGPVLNLYEKAKKFLGGECEPFYTGSLKHPNGS